MWHQQEALSICSSLHNLQIIWPNMAKFSKDEDGNRDPVWMWQWLTITQLAKAKERRGRKERGLVCNINKKHLVSARFRTICKLFNQTWQSSLHPHFFRFLKDEDGSRDLVWMRQWHTTLAPETERSIEKLCDPMHQPRNLIPAGNRHGTHAASPHRSVIGACKSKSESRFIVYVAHESMPL